MKYRLSLDLGVSSIGSAIIELDENNYAKNITDAGVRIFEVSEGSEDRREKKQARKNNRRTKKRLKLLAEKLHKKGFWTNSDPSGTKELLDLSPYAIRSHAIKNKLNNPFELGRAILHMAKHRGAGFVDAFGEFDEERADEENKKITEYEKLVFHLKETGARTIGEYFHIRLKPSLQKNEQKLPNVVRQKEKYVGKEVDYAIPRYLVKEEFNIIWDKQAEYFEELKDKDFKQAIYDIFFYENPPMPYANADCIYVDGEKRILKAHPLSEKRRIYEAVNNIRILSNTGKRKLTEEERSEVLNKLLLSGTKANKTSIGKLLGINRKEIVLSDNESGIQPYLYSTDKFTNLSIFNSISEQQLEKLVEFIAEPVNENNGKLYNEEQVISILKEELKNDDEIQIGEIISIIPKGRTTLSITATRKILELLKSDIISHREATDKLVKSGDDRFKSEEVLAQEIQGKYDKLPYYGEILKKDIQPIPKWQVERNKTLNQNEVKYGKIGNPAVHMMLNQLRLLVNDIIRIYGKPEEINIELARELGMSEKKKKEYEYNISRNRKLNDEAKEYLNENKLVINKQNILKYKLAKEQGWHCVFNPSERIDPRFIGYEIEHLIPRSRGGTDTLSNLVLINRNDNLKKGNSFPYEFFQKNKSDEQIREILKKVRSNKFIHESKKWRFEPDAEEKFEESGDENETNRFLTDTSYLSKLASRYLRSILNYQKQVDNDTTHTKILSVKGGYTAKLRSIWNLDGIEYELMGLDIPRYIECSPYWINEDTGEIIYGDKEPEIDGKWHFRHKEQNPDWIKKPRIDHRHHALDAIVLGCINRNFMQKLGFASKRGFKISTKDYPLPLSTLDNENPKKAREIFRNNVISLLKNTKISHKPDHSKLGQLHKETGKMILDISREHGDITITRVNKPILGNIKNKEGLKKLLIPTTIKSEFHSEIAEDREKLEKLVEDFKANFDEAEQNLKILNCQLKEDGKKEKNISEAMILQETLKIIQDKNLWRGDKYPSYSKEKSLIKIPKHNMAYTSGNNHRVDFFEKDEKINWQVINNFEANDKNFIPDSKKHGSKILWSVHQGDLIELDTPEKWQHFTQDERCFARIKKFSDRINISYFSDARMDSPPKDSEMYMKIEDLGLGFGRYGALNARKIELTPFGKVRKKHKKLWHGKKVKT